MKLKALVLSIAVVATVLTGCGKKADTTTAPKTETTKPATTQKADTVATASVVDNNEAFLKAISKDGGKYCIAILKDLTFDKDLVVEGDYKTGKKDKDGNLVKDAQGNEAIQRKVALYTQDANKKVTARFTLKAPKITFNSNYGSLEHGNFVGDVYVAGKYFKLVNAKIEGNLYFLNQEAMDTYQKAQDKADDEKTVITGKTELKK